MANVSDYLSNCLYFTANTLSRHMGKMAEAAFKDSGLSPSHAFMMMLINDRPGITQKELGEYLNLAPSTLTRFADKLVYQGYIERDQQGKLVKMYPTTEGEKLSKPIEAAWKRLYEAYSKILGKDAGDALTKAIDEANLRLNDLA